jgi:hypothetical protein
MKAILVEDDVVDLIRAYAGAADAADAMTGPQALLARLADLTIVDVNEQGPAGALEIVDEWRKRAERAEATLREGLASPDPEVAHNFGMAEALQTVVEQLTRAGVDIPGTGRVFPAAVGEMANAAADELERMRHLTEKGEAIAGLRRVLRAVAPQIVGFERRAVPGLVVEHVERLLRDRDGLRAALVEHRERVEELLEQREEARAALAGDVIVLALEHARTLREEAFHDLKASDLGADDLRAAAALATAIEEAEGR